MAAAASAPASAATITGGEGDVGHYAGLIRSCSRSKSLQQGRKLHSRITARGASFSLDERRYLHNLLLDMYGKCRSPEEARAVFEAIEEPNVFSWNIIIAAFAHNGRVAEARQLFDAMGERDIISWNAMLAAYAKARDVQAAQQLFDSMPKKDLISWNTMLAAYAQSGQIREAEQLFRRMQCKNVFSWNAMIGGYVRAEKLAEARVMFEAMPRRDVVSGNTMISAYAKAGQMERAREVFDSMPKRDAVAWTALMDGYAGAGRMGEARLVFESMPDRSVVSWNAMVAAYVRQGQMREARKLFDAMQRRDISSWNAMIAAYSQCGNLVEAKRLFDSMPQRDIASWNSILFAFARAGKLEEARAIFEKMEPKDVVSWNSMVAAYAQAGDLREAEALFASMPRKDLASWNAMLSAYAQCKGRLQEAKATFDRMPHKDEISHTALLVAYANNGLIDDARSVLEAMEGAASVVAWNAMMTAYIENEAPQEAIALFRRMDVEGVRMNAVTFVCVFEACAKATALADGRAFHNSIVGAGPWLSDLVVRSSLINMYGKCGSLGNAVDVFEGVTSSGSRPRNVEGWNSMLAALGHNGKARDTLQLLKRMLLEGVNPNEVTFTTVLSVCSHKGLLEDGTEVFRSLTQDFALLPTADHYGCVVDMLARASKTEDARSLLESMPFQPNEVAWTSLLSAPSKAASNMSGKVEEQLTEAGSHILANIRKAAYP